MKEKEKITFLDLVIPICIIYTTSLCFYNYFIEGAPEGNLKDVIILTIISFVFMYGVISIIRDLRLFGIRWMITSWRKISNK